MTSCFHNPSSPFNLGHRLLHLDPTMLRCVGRKSARSNPHRPIISAMIGRRPLSPRSNVALMHDGGWFSLPLHRHASNTEWDSTPSSFPTQPPMSVQAIPLTAHPSTPPVNLRVFSLSDDHWIYLSEIQRPTIISLLPPLISLLTHLRRLFAQSDDRYYSFIRLFHPLCSPRTLTVSSTRRTKVTSFQYCLQLLLNHHI